MPQDQPGMCSLMCPFSDEPFLLPKSNTPGTVNAIQASVNVEGVLIFDAKQSGEALSQDKCASAPAALLAMTPSTISENLPCVFNINGGKVASAPSSQVAPGTVLFDSRENSSRQSMLPETSSSSPLPIYVKPRNSYQSSEEDEEEEEAEVDYCEDYITDLNEKEITNMPFEAGYEGPQIGPNSTLNLDFVKHALIPYFMGNSLLDRKSVMSILLRAINIMSKESSLHDIRLAADETLVIFGDVHGQFPDFVKVLQTEGFPSAKLKFVRCQN